MTEDMITVASQIAFTIQYPKPNIRSIERKREINQKKLKLVINVTMH